MLLHEHVGKVAAGEKPGKHHGSLFSQGYKMSGLVRDDVNVPSLPMRYRGQTSPLCVAKTPAEVLGPVRLRSVLRFQTLEWH